MKLSNFWKAHNPLPFNQAAQLTPSAGLAVNYHLSEILMGQRRVSSCDQWARLMGPRVLTMEKASHEQEKGPHHLTFLSVLL